MPTDASGRRLLKRIPTGVPGLDTVLRGGFLRGGILILQGSPGAGKTILGNQICFHHVANGGRALYVTLLAENHARMLLHIGQLGFFEEVVIPGRLYYISAFRVLEQEGLPAVLNLLRREVQARGASLLVLDGLSAIEETAASGREFKKFIHELQAQAAIADCAMLLLTGVTQSSAEHTWWTGSSSSRQNFTADMRNVFCRFISCGAAVTCEASIRSASPTRGLSFIRVPRHCWRTRRSPIR